VTGIESVTDLAEAIAATVEGASPDNTPALMEIYLDEGEVDLTEYSPTVEGTRLRLAPLASADDLTSITGLMKRRPRTGADADGVLLHHPIHIAADALSGLEDLTGIRPSLRDGVVHGRRYMYAIRDGVSGGFARLTDGGHTFECDVDGMYVVMLDCVAGAERPTGLEAPEVRRLNAGMFLTAAAKQKAPMPSTHSWDSVCPEYLADEARHPEYVDVVRRALGGEGLLPLEFASALQSGAARALADGGPLPVPLRSSYPVGPGETATLDADLVLWMTRSVLSLWTLSLNADVAALISKLDRNKTTRTWVTSVRAWGGLPEGY